MKAGTLNRLVMLEQPIESVGSVYAQPVQTWSPIASVWAAIEPLSARELFTNQESGTAADYRIRIRSRTDITEKWRITYQGNVFTINTITRPTDSQAEFHILCTHVRSGESIAMPIP